LLKLTSAATATSLIENSAPGHENLTEKQVRPIASLKPEQQIAFAETHDIAAMTSREVEKAVKEYKQQH